MSADHYLLWGIVAHLVADWLLQNDWIAAHKSDLRHPAASVHFAIQTGALWLVFPPLAAVLLGISHLLIDTRRPLQWWRRVFRQTTDPANPASLHVAFWGDQVLHIVCLAVASGVVGR